MTIEELERDLVIAQNTIGRITEEIEKLKAAYNEILWQPKNGEEYWYVYYSFIMSKYHIKNDYSRGERNIISSFRTEEQASKACDYMNRIMPMLKLAIEKSSECTYGVAINGGEFSFHVDPKSDKMKLKIRTLYEQGKHNENS